MLEMAKISNNHCIYTNVHISANYTTLTAEITTGFLLWWLAKKKKLPSTAQPNNMEEKGKSATM